VELSLYVEFRSAFRGAKSVRVEALDLSGASSGYLPVGSYTTTDYRSAPSLSYTRTTPAPRAAFSIQFYAGDYSEPRLIRTQILFNDSLRIPGGCLVYYDDVNRKFLLLADDGSWLGPAPAGAALTLTNGRCTLHLASSTLYVSDASTYRSLLLDLSFTQDFAGTASNPKLHVYAERYAVGGPTSGYFDLGQFIP
jgi:hypothetical protein